MKRFASVLAVLLCVVLLSSCWRDPHGYFGEDSTELSRARYAQIVDALDRHDAASLKTMFTKSALADHSAELDAGVAYLLLLFPNGDIATKETNNIPASEYRRIDDDHRAILVRTMYRISSGGKDYWLFFADFTTNTIDPTNVGIYALGVEPRTATSNSAAEMAFFDWLAPFDTALSTPPSIYIPK